MAPIFSIEITDFRKSTTQVKLDQHYIFGNLSSDMKRINVLSNSFKSLKYFDNEAEFDIKVMQSKFNNSNLELKYMVYDAYRLFTWYCDRISNFPSDRIETTRSCLSKIMNTPFEINRDKRKWIIKAVLKRQGIHLYYEKNHNYDKLLQEKYEILKSHFFVKIPINYYRKVKTVFSEIFAELWWFVIGDHQVVYTTEVPGVISNNKITNIDELKSAEHVYCDIFKTGEFTQDIINYNPIWWSKAALIQAEQCIIGAYNNDNDSIEDIIKLNLDKFKDTTKYENLWSPNAAWNFLNDFLQFVKDSVNSVSIDVKHKCIWQFESFPNDKPVVTCEIFYSSTENGKETITPLPFESVNFH